MGSGRRELNDGLGEKLRAGGAFGVGECLSGICHGEGGSSSFRIMMVWFWPPARSFDAPSSLPGKSGRPEGIELEGAEKAAPSKTVD